MHPFKEDRRTFVQRDTDKLHRSAVIDEGPECMLRDEVREHKARIFGSVCSPGTCHMLMAKRLSFADIFQESLVMLQSCLFIVQRELAPHKDLVRSFRKMHAIPRLQTDSRRKCVDILHWYVLFAPVINVCSPL